MKSKQELIEEWESAIEAAEFYGKGKEERLISYMKDFVSDLNQLDEPDEREQLEIAYKDILSRREFLFDGKEYVVVEKPTIPKFVADWIVECKEIGFTIQQIFYQVHSEYKQNIMSPTSEWINENEGLFAESYLHGYEVEEEQKYYVIFKQEDTCTVTLNKNGGIGTIFRTGSEIPKSFQLTEQEIKDYDPRYMAFAKPVEELE